MQLLKKFIKKLPSQICCDKKRLLIYLMGKFHIHTKKTKKSTIIKRFVIPWMGNISQNGGAHIIPMLTKKVKKSNYCTYNVFVIKLSNYTIRGSQPISNLIGVAKTNSVHFIMNVMSKQKSCYISVRQVSDTNPKYCTFHKDWYYYLELVCSLVGIYTNQCQVLKQIGR